MSFSKLIVAACLAGSAALAASAQGDIEFPGTWSYASTVPGGKGYVVEGTEYIYQNTVNSPPTYDTGNVFSSITDKQGNISGYSSSYHQGQMLAPYLSYVSFSGGGTQQLFYASRRNIWMRGFTGADGTSTIAFTKNFDATCDYIVSCNQPNWVKDGEGNQTDYTYSNTHGGVLTMTRPADISGIRPQTRYVYEQKEARYKNASGQIVASGQPIWMLTSEKFCRTSAASGSNCAAGAADEVVTTYDYGPATGANNLWLRGKVVTANGQSLRTCYYYDDFGNKIAETQPNASLTSCN
jgi:YD repeat-containing protein